MSHRSNPSHPARSKMAVVCVMMGWIVATANAATTGGVPSLKTHTVHNALLAKSMDIAHVAHVVSPYATTLATTLLLDARNETPDEIEWLSSILLNPANEKSVRRGAAERLLAMRDEAAHEPLTEALSCEDSTLMLAVIEAMRDAPHVDRSIVITAAKAIRTVPDEALEPLAALLAAHNGEAMKIVQQLANDRELSDEERLGPIRALGSFRSRNAAVQLMALIDEPRGESNAIIEAACESLQHATGLPYGNDPQAWQQWWREARDQPREEWLTNLVRRLSDQLAAAERQIQDEQRLGRQLENRLAELYRDLFPRFSIDEQLKILPGLLDDPLPAVRVSALDRIARLLRDSVRIPEDVQKRMLARLNDEIPAIRLQVIRLLDQLNDDETPIRLVERLESETDAKVVSAILDVLTRRPAPNSAETLLYRLTNEVQSKRAAAAMWALLSTNPRNDEHEDVNEESSEDSFGERVLEAVENIEHWTESAAHVRLYSRFVPRDDQERIEALLDADADDIRRAAAEGLIAQKWDQPVLDRANDPVMQPLVMRLLAQQESTISGFRRLAMLEVDGELKAKWQSSVTTLAENFHANQLLELDELLSNASHATKDLRAELLSRIETVDGESVDENRRAATLTRLALLRLQLDQPDAALSAMERVPEDLLVSEARRVKFEAAARNGEFDLAASLIDDVDEWIALLNGLVERSPRSAAALHAEIMRRFADELDEERKSQLDAVSERLEVATRAPAATIKSPA